MPGLAMHRSNCWENAYVSKSTVAPFAWYSAAAAREASFSWPAAITSSLTREPSSPAQYEAAALPDLPRPRTSTAPSELGAFFFVWSKVAVMFYPINVFAKYRQKPKAASAAEIIQKRITTFTSLQPFFSKW